MVALQAHIADTDIGEQAEKRFHHAEAGAQDGHDDQRPGEHPAQHRLKRRRDLLLLRGEITRGLQRQQQRDLVAQGSKERRFGGLVAQVREHVGGEGMLDDGQGHFEI